jgi:hypothetical protein
MIQKRKYHWHKIHMTTRAASKKAGMSEFAAYDYHKRAKEQYPNIFVPRPVEHYK